MLEKWSVLGVRPERGCDAGHKLAIKVFSQLFDVLPRENKNDGVLKSTFRALNGRLATLAFRCQANTLMAGCRTERTSSD
jgi:hypothetical protein